MGGGTTPRHIFHGFAPLKAGNSPALGAERINLKFRKVL